MNLRELVLRPALCSLALTALCSGVLSACVTIPPPSCKVPDKATIELESSDRLNPDERGRPLPTIVRLYQLTDLGKLQGVAFDEIWERDQETLGNTLVKSDELTIYPGQFATRRIQRDPKADYLVGVAVFRTPIGSAWRTIQEWPLEGDPCQERKSKRAAPKLDNLRVRMFLENYRIESVNNYLMLPKRHCSPGDRSCGGDVAPDELPQARDRRLRTFEEDPTEVAQ